MSEYIVVSNSDIRGGSSEGAFGAEAPCNCM